jgi:hypothetical protein
VGGGVPGAARLPEALPRVGDLARHRRPKLAATRGRRARLLTTRAARQHGQ